MFVDPEELFHPCGDLGAFRLEVGPLAEQGEADRAGRITQLVFCQAGIEDLDQPPGQDKVGFREAGVADLLHDTGDGQSERVRYQYALADCRLVAEDTSGALTGDDYAIIRFQYPFRIALKEAEREEIKEGGVGEHRPGRIFIVVPYDRKCRTIDYNGTDLLDFRITIF